MRATTLTPSERQALIESVKASIRNRPENWNQVNWIKDAEFTRPPEARDEICGTQMCTAGWMAFNSGLVKIDYIEDRIRGAEVKRPVFMWKDGSAPVDVSDLASELLNLSEDQTDTLFWATEVKDPEIMCNLIDAVLAWPDGEMPDDWEYQYSENIVPGSDRYGEQW